MFIESLEGLTEGEIVAQSLVFFLAGYETVSATLTNTSYLLALHPEVQERLREEINSVMDKSNKVGPLHHSNFGFLPQDLAISQNLSLL